MNNDVDLGQVSLKYKDVLQEISNIGAGNAMTALAEMLNCKVDMTVPKVQLLEFHEVGDIMGGAEQTMAGVFLGVEGDITASMMFLVGIDSAKRLLYKITGGMLTGEEIGEMERSAIMEVGNIITGAYLNALSMMTNMKIFPTPPQLSIDMASAILSVPATYFGMNGDQILLIQTKFFDEAEIDGYFVLIPDLESYGKILSSLGISMEV